MAIFLSILYYLLLIAYAYTIIVCVSVVLLDNRSPTQSLLWVVALIMLPFIGLVFYVFFGRNHRKKKIVQSNQHKILPKPEYALGMKDLITSDLEKHLQKTARLLFKNSGSHPYIDTKVEMLVGGNETFERIFADIENAKQHIHIEFYIIEDDTVGNELRRLLIRKAQEKVRIRVIYDYLGGFRLSDAYIKSLRNAGVFIQPFLPFNLRFGYGKINYRNHRKLVVIDGKIGYTGGINIANRYIYGNRLGKWRDTSVRLEGSAVHGLQNLFLTDWQFVDNKAVINEKYFPEPKTFSQNVVQIVPSGPDTDWETILQGIITVFSNARKNIYIHTPYFLPPESLMTAIEMAALSGVDVRLMVPYKTDTILATAASSSYYERVMVAGARIFFYKENFLHSKAITVDNEIGIVGTANMDIRSFEQNFEVNAFIYDEAVAKNLRNAFEEDAKFCEEIELETWKKRRPIQRFKESLARLFSPVL